MARQKENAMATIHYLGAVGLLLVVCLASGEDGPAKSPLTPSETEKILKRAEQGNPAAQFLMGTLFDQGMGVEKNAALAFEWYLKGATQGYANAQNALGACYSKGEVVPKDDELAVFWFLKSAQQGNADAQVGLGVNLAMGRGVKKDGALAVLWLRKAADQENALAQYLIGLSYAEGNGVPKDNVLAYMWYNLAAAKGALGAANDRDDLAKVMTTEAIAEAQRLSREWKPNEVKK
jgi:uncharacterized protein